MEFNRYAFEYIDDSKEEFPSSQLNYAHIVQLKN